MINLKDLWYFGPMQIYSQTALQSNIILVNSSHGPPLSGCKSVRNSVVQYWFTAEEECMHVDTIEQEIQKLPNNFVDYISNFTMLTFLFHQNFTKKSHTYFIF